MDEMKLNLGSKFMRKMVSKLISKYLSKRIGSKVTLDLNALNVRLDDGDTVIKTKIISCHLHKYSQHAKICVLFSVRFCF